MPLKVNCFVWLLFRNKILTSVNLIKRGIQISSSVYLFCHVHNEYTDHVLFSCFYLFCHVHDECTDHVLFSCSSFAFVVWRWMVVWSSCLQMQPSTKYGPDRTDWGIPCWFFQFFDWLGRYNIYCVWYKSMKHMVHSFSWKGITFIAYDIFNKIIEGRSLIVFAIHNCSRGKRLKTSQRSWFTLKI